MVGVCVRMSMCGDGCLCVEMGVYVWGWVSMCGDVGLSMGMWVYVWGCGSMCGFGRG